MAFDNGDSMVTNIDATATPLANIIANGIQTFESYLNESEGKNVNNEAKSDGFKYSGFSV